MRYVYFYLQNVVEKFPQKTFVTSWRCYGLLTKVATLVEFAKMPEYARRVVQETFLAPVVVNNGA